jgi:hypothetical protein
MCCCLSRQPIGGEGNDEGTVSDPFCVLEGLAYAKPFPPFLGLFVN